jgi:hypothetical protein
MLEGEQDAVTPVGVERPVRPTVPVKPPLGVKPIVEVALCPATNETLVGLAHRVKSGVEAAVTETLIVAVRVRDPLVPVIVTVYVPAVEPVIVHVEVCVPLMVDGEQEGVTPEGEELPASATVPVKPPVAVMPIEDVAL